MSNKRAYFIWFSLSIKSSRSFHLALPVPLILFLYVSDFLEDVAVFVPNAQSKADRKMSPASVKQILHACSDFLREIALHTEPFDLADIDVTDKGKRVIVKCIIK